MLCTSEVKKMYAHMGFIEYPLIQFDEGHHRLSSRDAKRPSWHLQQQKEIAQLLKKLQGII